MSNLRTACPLCKQPVAILRHQALDGTPTTERYLGYHDILVARPPLDPMTFGPGKLWAACPFGGLTLLVHP